MFTFDLKKQKGIVLVVSLIMLLVMTLVGVTVMTGATLQEKMAGNNRQLSIARLNAEAALRAGELFVQNLDVNSVQDIAVAFADADDGLYTPVYSVQNFIDHPPQDMTEPSNWSAVNSVEVLGLDVDISAPRYFIEYIGRLNDSGGRGRIVSIDKEEANKTLPVPFVFRITAIGYGANENITAILQSIYSTSQGVSP